MHSGDSALQKTFDRSGIRDRPTRSILAGEEPVTQAAGYGVMDAVVDKMSLKSNSIIIRIETGIDLLTTR